MPQSHNAFISVNVLMQNSSLGSNAEVRARCCQEEPCFQTPAFSLPGSPVLLPFLLMLQAHCELYCASVLKLTGIMTAVKSDQISFSNFYAVTTEKMFIFKKKRVQPLPLNQNSYISQKKKKRDSVDI